MSNECLELISLLDILEVTLSSTFGSSNFPLLFGITYVSVI